jgi:hypothetical protein
MADQTFPDLHICDFFFCAKASLAKNRDDFFLDFEEDPC